MRSQNLTDTFIATLFDWWLSFLVYYLLIYLYELTIHIIFMAFCQLLIAVIWYLKILPIREESEGLFCFINTFLVLSLVSCPHHTHYLFSDTSYVFYWRKKPRKFHGVLLARSSDIYFTFCGTMCLSKTRVRMIFNLNFYELLYIASDFSCIIYMRVTSFKK